MALNSGDMAWVIAATALVMIMTPGVGFFYGGLVRRKNLVSTIVQSMAVFSVISLVWALWGYSLAFGPDVYGVIGNLSKFGLNGVGATPDIAYSSTIPDLLHFAFQLKFAAIAPALIIGAFVERIRFKALLIFVVLWTSLIYLPIAHWVWAPGGWLRSLGVMDFAGGLVIHTAAGVSALAAALAIGPRKGLERVSSRPNNIPFVILGTAILWLGWFGFNAVSALAANDIAVNALVTTNLSAAAGGVSWMLTDWLRHGKPSAVGMCMGTVCALASATPASGFVGPLPAMGIGFAAGILGNFVAGWRARSRFDDSLDVFACHGVGGAWGVVATGLFASVLINPAGRNGLLFGNAGQIGVQLFAIVVVAGFAFVGSYLLLRLINIYTRVRVGLAEEDAGLDVSEFGEEAYDFDE